MSVFNLFKNKKPPDPQLEFAPVCHHKWQEFPWYIEGLFVYKDSNHDYGSETISIYKPYVCVHCKKRKDVLLQELKNAHIHVDEADKWLDETKKSYKNYIESRAIVESKINDFQLVDHEYLAIIESLRTYDISPEKLKEYSNAKKEDQPRYASPEAGGTQ